MPSKNTDVVRRSLFGSAEMRDKNDTSVRQRKPSAKQSRDGRNVSEAAEPSDIAGDPASRTVRRRVERTAVTVPTDLLMRVKDAVAVLNGWPHQYTMARFVEEAFAAQLERVKIEHNGGREFPITNRKIRTGRPPGT